MFALLSAAYMLGLVVADPCVSEKYDVPGKNETVVYKCVRTGHAIPPMIKDPARVPAAYIPPEKPEVADKPAKQTKKVSRLCGNKTPVWYVKNGKKRYRCK